MKPFIQKNTTIVLLGDFNPKIFQPAWFAAQGLVRQEDAETAEISIIHRDVAAFSLDWVAIQVVRERFQARPTKEGHDQEIRDLVLGTFRLLKHTPLRSMGINKSAHWKMDSIEAWHALGHRLAPKDFIWDKILDTPGMRSLVVSGKRPDSLKGYIHVKVEPSTVENPGIYVEVNDHFEVSDKEKGSGADEIVDILRQQWPDSDIRSERILNELMELSCQQP